TALPAVTSLSVAAYAEKSRMVPSFLAAVVIHLILLFGSRYAWIHLPEYGIEGSAGSMEVYMVAALPDQKQKPKPAPAAFETPVEIPVAQSEMMIYQETKQETAKGKAKAAEEEKEKEEKRPDPVKTDPEVKTEAVGDGSSPVPGKSKTTFFSINSSDIAGKEGKYQNRAPSYPAEALRD